MNPATSNNPPHPPGRFNLYCDESCHLEHDRIPVMTLGCVWCPTERAAVFAKRLREIKGAHGLVRPEEYQGGNLGQAFEVKWSKVSAGKAAFYENWIDAFFDEPELHFRGIVIPDKTKLEHDQFGQDHDQWYYKMMYLLVDRVINPKCAYRVFLDIKDTRSEERRAKLEEVLRNSARDAAGQVIERVQQIRSHESELLQLADLLLGAVGYQNRRTVGDLKDRPFNAGKMEVVRRIQRRSNQSLTATTWQGKTKLNLLVWEPRTGGFWT